MMKRINRNDRIIYAINMGSKTSTVEAKKAVVQQSTPLHWHDCYEMELVVGGCGTHIINGTKYPMRVGDFYLLTPEDFHEVISDEPITTLGIMFDEKLVSEELLFNIPVIRITASELLTCIDGEIYNLVSNYFVRVLEEVNEEEKSLSTVYISKLTECIMIELFRAVEGKTVGITQKAVNDVLIYIHSHYTENLSLASLAELLHFSPSYLSMYFKENIGKNFKEYLITLRMKHAARLLANTELSVTEICYSCGFSSYSHFMRTFKSNFRQTPLSFRSTFKKVTDRKEN